MKKIISLLLALILLSMAFVACDSKKDNDDDDNDLSENLPTRGEISENVYKNDYLDFEFTKPDSWVYSTDEELAATVNLGAEYLGDKYEEAIKNSPSIYDMMVTDTITRTNILVSYENLKVNNASNITVEQYINAVKSQFAQISSMQVTFPDQYDTVQLGKSKYTRVVCDTIVSGVKMTQVFYIRKMDGYMAVINVTITNGYTVADIEKMFE